MSYFAWTEGRGNLLASMVSVISCPTVMILGQDENYFFNDQSHWTWVMLQTLGLSPTLWLLWLDSKHASPNCCQGCFR